MSLTSTGLTDPRCAGFARRSERHHWFHYAPAPYSAVLVCDEFGNLRRIDGVALAASLSNGATE